MRKDIECLERVQKKATKLVQEPWKRSRMLRDWKPCSLPHLRNEG